MSFIKGHFDGTAVVLDEPAVLVVGQTVRILLTDSEPASASSPSLVGSWKGKFRILDEGDDIVLNHFSAYLP